MKSVLILGVLAIGGWICLTNFYLSYIRYFLFLRRGGKKDEYKFISGFPLIGSTVVALTLVIAKPEFWVSFFFILIAGLDTGGLHWFIGSQIYHALSRKKIKSSRIVR